MEIIRINDTQGDILQQIIDLENKPLKVMAMLTYG